MENHHFWWENQLFLWSFSIAMLVITRGYRLFIIIIIHNIDIWLYVIACYNLYNYYNIKHIIILVGGLEHEFYDFPYIENDSPNWLLFFRGIETTNQYRLFNGISGYFFIIPSWYIVNIVISGYNVCQYLPIPSHYIILVG